MHIGISKTFFGMEYVIGASELQRTYCIKYSIVYQNNSNLIVSSILVTYSMYPVNYLLSRTGLELLIYEKRLRMRVQ